MVTIHMPPIYSSCTALQYTTFFDIVAHFTQIFFEGSKKISRVTKRLRLFPAFQRSLGECRFLRMEFR